MHALTTLTSPFRLRSVLRTVLLAFSGGALLLYAAVEARAYLAGITISIHTPTNGTTVHEPLIHVTGVIQHAAFITLNGRELLTDESGTFEQRVLVSPGYNLLTITAEDRFGRVKEQRLVIVYRP